MILRMLSVLIVVLVSTRELNGQEFTFGPDRRIEYLTRGAIEEIVGCKWFQPCYNLKRGKLISYPVLRVEQNPYLEALDNKYHLEYLCFYDRHRLPILLVVGGANKSLLLVLHKYPKAVVEYRPLFNPEDQSYEPGDKSSVTIKRRPFSASFEDITSYSAEFLSSSELAKYAGLGLEWGDEFPEVRRKLKKKGIQPESLEDLRWRWYMPEWEHLRNEGRATPYSWARGIDNERGFYLFADENYRVIFLMDFYAEEGLQGIFRYADDGSMEVVRNVDAKVIRGDLPSNIYGSLEWSAGEPDCLTLDEKREQRRYSAYESRSRQSILVDPARFFRGEGAAFGSWLNESEHAYSPDYSWKIGEKKYYACIGESWFSDPPPPAMPGWHILEFTGEKLTGIYDYNEYWEMTELRPPLSWWSIAIPALATSGIMLLGGIYFQRRSKRRRKRARLLGQRKGSGRIDFEREHGGQSEPRKYLPRED